MKDVEASLHEALLDSFHDLVASRAVSAGATGKAMHPPPPPSNGNQGACRTLPSLTCGHHVIAPMPCVEVHDCKKDTPFTIMPYVLCPMHKVWILYNNLRR